MTAKEKRDKWLEAFGKNEFQEKLLSYRNEIEKKLKEFIKHIKDEQSIKMFDSLESRIKTESSFSEKLFRNEYINYWELTEDILKNQSYIQMNLPDIIGFRVSCYFIDDEKKIFDSLLKYHFESLSLDPNTNVVQEDGHNIYKLSGKYDTGKETCCFEIQIKSLAHNFHGEIEHETIYKRRNFDYNIQERKNITEGTYKVLEATDTQLLSLHNMNYSRDRLVQALFFEITKEQVKEIFSTDILGKAYNNFFQLFYKDYKNEFVSFVANKLLEKEFPKVKYKYLNKTINAENLVKLENAIRKKYRFYGIDLIKGISNLFFEIKDDVVFFQALAYSLDPSYYFESFGDEPDFTEDTNDDKEKEELDYYDFLTERLSKLDLKEIKERKNGNSISK